MTKLSSLFMCADLRSLVYTDRCSLQRLRSPAPSGLGLTSGSTLLRSGMAAWHTRLCQPHSGALHNLWGTTFKNIFLIHFENTFRIDDNDNWDKIPKQNKMFII